MAFGQVGAFDGELCEYSSQKKWIFCWVNDQEKKNQRKIYLRVQLLVMKILMENVEEKTMKRKKHYFRGELLATLIMITIKKRKQQFQRGAADNPSTKGCPGFNQPKIQPACSCHIRS